MLFRSELARVKIESNAIAESIEVNLKHLRELDAKHRPLFPDAQELVQKAEEDLVATIKMRTTEFDTAEAERIESERLAEERRVEDVRLAEEARIQKVAEDEAALLEQERLTRRIEEAPTVDLSIPDCEPDPVAQEEVHVPIDDATAAELPVGEQIGRAHV